MTEHGIARLVFLRRRAALVQACGEISVMLYAKFLGMGSPSLRCCQEKPLTRQDCGATMDLELYQSSAAEFHEPGALLAYINFNKF